MIRIERKAFFDALRTITIDDAGTVRRIFPKGFTQQQVDGLGFLLASWEKSYQDRTPVTQFANILGTVMLETGGTFQPIHEFGNRSYFQRMYDIEGSRPHVARVLGNINPGDGARYPGRGYPQLTGRANYRRATRRLRELGIIGADVDFERDPDLVMKPEYAIPIMFIGMEEGWFTGRTLDQTIDEVVDGDEHADFLRARAIINGTDKAELIADYSWAFLTVLRRATRTATPGEIERIPDPELPKPPSTADVVAQVEAADKAAVPPSDRPPQPPPVTVPSPANPEPKGWFAHLLDLMRSHRKG